MYSERIYRVQHKAANMVAFKINIKETDLWIAVDKNSFSSDMPNEVEKLVIQQRDALESYIKVDPHFYTALNPYLLRSDAPLIAKEMAAATSVYGIGPMAAVAGTFADYVGIFLSHKCKEVIVENGGDIFLKTLRPRTVAVFAGNSLFSNRIGIKISKNSTRGICTSSGTVGPSLSFGKSDATVVIAKKACFADAAATMLGNLIQTEEDIQKVLEVSKKIKGILGVLIIKNSKMGAYGEVELVSLDNNEL